MSSITQHIKSFHNENKLFKCTICANRFEKKSYLHQHKECVHESNVPYKCELCQEEFERKKLNGHIESVHEGNKPYERNLQNVTFVVNDFS